MANLETSISMDIGQYNNNEQQVIGQRPFPQRVEQPSRPTQSDQGVIENITPWSDKYNIGHHYIGLYNAQATINFSIMMLDEKIDRYDSGEKESVVIFCSLQQGLEGVILTPCLQYTSDAQCCLLLAQQQCSLFNEVKYIAVLCQ